MNELVQTLVNQLGISDHQAKGGMGAFLKIAKDKLNSGDFSQITNILGAGDAFGSGFIYGYVNEWSWYKSARLGNACGAIVVTEHGCANFTPTMDEILAFVEPYGGLD